MAVTKPQFLLLAVLIGFILDAAIGGAVLMLGLDAKNVAHATCEARNQGIIRSNGRWALEKKAWNTAAKAREASAAVETGVQRDIDIQAALVYRQVANAFVPYETIPCH